MAKKVIHIDSGSSATPTSQLWKYTATNYADLLTKVDMVEGDLSIVYNSQGIWGINRKLKGVYIYQSGVWEYANDELQQELTTSQYKVKVDSTDPTGAYLEDKFKANSDVYVLKNLSPKSLSLLVRKNLKPVITYTDPTVNDDGTVMDSNPPQYQKHSIGQLWVNLSPGGSSFRCRGLATGAAVWEKQMTTNPPLSIVLGIGNETNGNDIIVNENDALIHEYAGFLNNISTNPLTSNRVQTHQDKDGIIALLSDILQQFNVDLDSSESSVSRVFSGGRTTFIVTHNLGTLDIKPQVFRLSDGRNVGWRLGRTGINTVEASRTGNVADGLFRILI